MLHARIQCFFNSEIKCNTSKDSFGIDFFLNNFKAGLSGCQSRSCGRCQGGGSDAFSGLKFLEIILELSGIK